MCHFFLPNGEGTGEAQEKNRVAWPEDIGGVQVTSVDDLDKGLIVKEEKGRLSRCRTDLTCKVIPERDEERIHRVWGIVTGGSKLTTETESEDLRPC